MSLLTSSIARGMPVVVALCLLVVPAAHAESSAAVSFNVSGGAFGSGTQNVTLGYAFTANATITVTDLGVYDFQSNGLGSAHDVGIFDSTGTLLVSTTVPSGTTAPLINQFRYTSVTPFILGPGTYNIGAFYGASGTDTIRAAVQNFTTAPQITFLENRGLPSTSLANPTAPDGSSALTPGYFGPNFLFTPFTPAATQSAPEPAGLALLSPALPLLGIILRRRKRRI